MDTVLGRHAGMSYIVHSSIGERIAILYAPVRVRWVRTVFSLGNSEALTITTSPSRCPFYSQIVLEEGNKTVPGSV